MTDNKPPFIRYNACSDPCDILNGPCCCGAWHSQEEWQLLYNKIIDNQTRLGVNYLWLVKNETK